jgi:hypothetical protein
MPWCRFCRVIVNFIGPPGGSVQAGGASGIYSFLRYEIRRYVVE